MGRRYYCEYCDKTFVDELEARRKHLQSANHVKLRNLHYQQCREPAVILREELLKQPCRKFFQSGTCMFEGSCKYTHYSTEQLCQLRQQVEQVDLIKQKEHEMKTAIPSVESWLEKYDKIATKHDPNVINTPWTYPESFANRIDLPPSLIKFKAEHFFDDNFEEWGQ
ncbi:zinc finger matrin-type protein 5 [Anthonomus grandis grandis]|uniref:zinc finger matrin-type protein 5 n=1 Tax=Anthonomus grandis grandis TaxID=2921223 RepID=UPI002166015D|nr:zinc finger matrin-type protein 5 [Anthonomus grandis grandis]